MSIIRKCLNKDCQLDQIPANAYSLLDDKEFYIGEFYKGCVLRLDEHNYYDDSDFFAVCWSFKEDKPVEWTYASTRFGGSDDVTVDATPEVQALYQNYIRSKKRKKENQKRMEFRNIYLRYSHVSGLSIRQTLKVMRSLAEYYWESVLVKLLGPYHRGTIRSEYRKSLAEQVMAWVSEDNPKYTTPLSKKQLYCL